MSKKPKTCDEKSLKIHLFRSIMEKTNVKKWKLIIQKKGDL